MLSLSQLAIYPIKSCAQISLNKASLGPFGLNMDRRWMLIDENGHMLTQRKHARMCLIHCSLNGDRLIVTAPGMEPLTITPVNDRETLSATVWNDTCHATECGSEAATWFSDFLKTSARLVYFPDNEKRQIDLDYAREGEITAFSDGFPYLLISQASLDDLNEKLDVGVEMKRFRPNLVIDGSCAYEEDDWKRVRIGDISFKLVKPCSRCIIPSIDPSTGLKSAEPLKTLASYRLREHKIFFGQNLIAESTGTLQVGMPVEVLE